MVKIGFFKILTIGVIIQLFCLNAISCANNIDYSSVSNNSFYKDYQNEGFSQINISFESNNYRLYGEIYFPNNLSRTYPAVVFCEGMGGYVDAYSWIPKALAEEGYVTMIFDFPGQGKSDGILPFKAINISFLNIFFRYTYFLETPIHYFLRNWATATSDALTFLLEKSPVNNIINNSTVGLIGHSLGGITVTEVASIDDRVDAVVALSQGNPLIIKKIKVPIQFQGGCFDLTTYSIPIISRCYKKADSPKELIAIQFATHIGFSTAFGPFCPCPKWQKDICLRYAIGWFDYFLKNKTDAYDTITTGVNHLSKFVKSRYNFGEGEHFLT